MRPMLGRARRRASENSFDPEAALAQQLLGLVARGESLRARPFDARGEHPLLAVAHQVADEPAPPPVGAGLAADLTVRAALRRQDVAHDRLIARRKGQLVAPQPAHEFGLLLGRNEETPFEPEILHIAFDARVAVWNLGQPGALAS